MLTHCSYFEYVSCGRGQSAPDACALARRAVASADRLGIERIVRVRVVVLLFGQVDDFYQPPAHERINTALNSLAVAQRLQLRSFALSRTEIPRPRVRSSFGTLECRTPHLPPSRVKRFVRRAYSALLLFLTRAAIYAQTPTLT